jgi:CRP-like cAMP-binding protein
VPKAAIYFMEAGFASVVAVQAKETKVEVGLIGREGMTGLSIVFGDHKTPHETYMQAAGHGQRINATKLRKATEASPSLLGLFLKFAQAFMVQTAHTAIANARAKIDVRLARWILMAHDRLDGNKLPLTHEFLSLMLGVRRAGVTETLHALESQGLIVLRGARLSSAVGKASSARPAIATAFPRRSIGASSAECRSKERS